MRAYLIFFSFFCFISTSIISAPKAVKAVKVNREFNADLVDYVDNEIIVVFKHKYRQTISTKQKKGQAPEINVGSLQALVNKHGVEKFERQFKNAKPKGISSRVPDLTGHYKVKVKKGQELNQVIADFSAHPFVEKVEKIGIHPIFVDANDPYYRDSTNSSFPFDQWGLFDRGSEQYSMQADLAWGSATGNNTVVIAILDSGTRYIHNDLGGSNPPSPTDNVTNGNIFVNPNENPGNGIDDDNNGYIDDVIGYDFVSSLSGGCPCCDEDCGVLDNDPSDHNGHGTHVSGTAAAATNNGFSGAGVAGGFSSGNILSTATGVKIMPLRVGWNADCGGSCSNGFVRMDFAAEAMNYVAEMVDQGVNIAAINCSWGSSNSGGIDAAVDNLLAHDVMIIHAAGNQNSSVPNYLGSKAGVMNVAASTRTGTGASFTNYGDWVDVAAPGVDILSTWHNYADPTHDYIALLSGTSMSAPHITGLAGLLESCKPSLSAQDKFNVIVNNTRPYNDSRDLGSGIANAKMAIDSIAPCASSSCSSDSECNDNDACTVDTCDGGTGQCSFAPKQTTCGDGLCECFENSANCAADCGSCGNGVCDVGEDCIDCPGDCPKGDGATCGNNICEASSGENCISCPADCHGQQSGKKQDRFCCGNGGGENAVSCSDARCSAQGRACTSLSTSQSCCGDAQCNGVEDGFSCAIDCGAPPFCGDSSCDSNDGEDKCNCPSDCGQAPSLEDSCTDGVDNDCDNEVDCNDSDCAANSECQCIGLGRTCSFDSECCSNKCRGRSGNKSCK